MIPGAPRERLAAMSALRPIHAIVFRCHARCLLRLASLCAVLTLPVALAATAVGRAPLGQTVAATWIALAALLVAMIAVLRIRYGEAETRGGWRLIGAAAVLWGVGRLGDVTLGESSTGSWHSPIAHLSALLMPPLMAAGLLQLGILGQPTHVWWRRLVVSAFAALALAVPLALILVRVGPASSAMSLLERALWFARLTSDGAILIATALLIGGNRSLTARSAALLTLPLAVVADLCWLMAQAFELPAGMLLAAVAWLAAIGALALSVVADRQALSRALRSLASVSSLLSVAVVLLAALAVGWTALRATVGRQDALVIVVGLGSIALVAMRQHLALRDALQLARHFSQASERDHLTGLLHQTAAVAQLEAELERARRLGNPVAVAMIDIDDFKGVNDNHGHQAGDAVLRELAQVLASSCRETDIVARYGGDEFLLVLPGLGLNEARGVGQRLLAQLSRHRDFIDPSSGADISLSIGLAVTVTGALSARDLIAIADSAMYDVKRWGKNRVHIVNADTLTTEALFSQRNNLPRPRQRLSPAYRVQQACLRGRAMPVLIRSVSHVDGWCPSGSTPPAALYPMQIASDSASSPR